jgi:uncharacterized phiE125 gp8 family phage protein
VEPLDPAKLKGPLRIDYADDDEELRSLIVEARQWAESKLGRVLINQTVTEKFRDLGDTLELRWPAVSSITSVAYIDTNGTSQTLATSVYELGQHLGIGRVRLKYGQVWPSTRDQHDAVTVTYVAGYGTAATNVPKAIRQAMTLYIQYRYDGSIDEQLLTAARRLLGPYSARR